MENATDRSDSNSPITEPTLRRLPIYHQYLKGLDSARVPAISCTQIAQALHLTPIQVRKDLAATGIVGKPKTGYEVEALRAAIENFLGWDNCNEALLFGAGHLGTALMMYEGFRASGLDIVAAVDPDPARQGALPNDKKVLPLSKAPGLIRRMHIKIAVLTVPEAAAQAAADLCVAAGIKAIWNFSPAKINVPGDVVVQHENLASSLAVLSKKLGMSGR